jgi:hypothetical protein
MTTQAPKTPKGKATFKAVDPAGQVAYRTSARDYTYACAVFWPAEPERTRTTKRLLKFGETAPEDAFDIAPTEYKNLRYPDGTPEIYYSIKEPVAAKPECWGIVSFNGSEALALKAASQFRATIFRAVPVEIVEDRRQAKQA